MQVRDPGVPESFHIRSAVFVRQRLLKAPLPPCLSVGKFPVTELTCTEWCPLAQVWTHTHTYGNAYGCECGATRQPELKKPEMPGG